MPFKTFCSSVPKPTVPEERAGLVAGAGITRGSRQTQKRTTALTGVVFPDLEEAQPAWPTWVLSTLVLRGYFQHNSKSCWPLPRG